MSEKLAFIECLSSHFYHRNSKIANDSPDYVLIILLSGEDEELPRYVHHPPTWDGVISVHHRILIPSLSERMHVAHCSLFGLLNFVEEILRFSSDKFLKRIRRDLSTWQLPLTS